MPKKSLAQEFIEFINRGNVVDLAVGVIIGGAFTGVVNALVSNIIQPLIAAVGGSAEVKGLSVIVGGQTIDFGGFISAVISFLITALAVFAIVKGVNTLNDLKDLAARKAGLAKQAAEDSAPEPRTCPYCRQKIADDATRCPHCTAKLTGYENPLD